MDTGEGCIPLILAWIRPCATLMDTGEGCVPPYPCLDPLLHFATNMAMLVLVCTKFGVFFETNSVAGRPRAAVEERTFSLLLQCFLTVDLLSPYSGP